MREGDFSRQPFISGFSRVGSQSLSNKLKSFHPWVHLVEYLPSLWEVLDMISNLGYRVRQRLKAIQHCSTKSNWS